MGFQFGSYESICDGIAMTCCPLLGNGLGLEPLCYSRNVEINNTIIFQPATCFIHVGALIMTAIMVYHIRSKYTAVGRKEIVLFFYLYALSEVLVIFLDSAIVPTYSAAYLWLTAVYIGLKTATFWCLLLNGFVGFQFAEDGTPKSLWSLRISSLLLWGVGFFVSLATFKGIAGMSPTQTTALFVLELGFPLVCVFIYVVSQVILVLRTLDDRWPLGDIFFGTGFFAAGLVLMYGFGKTICKAIKHYIDGTFFGSLCMLLAVMMVYKYWDSITKEDLEFSVGSKQSVWEVKDNFLVGGGGGGGVGSEDMGGSAMTHESSVRGSPSRLTPPQQGYKGAMGYPPNGQYGAPY
ncbi:Chitin synthase, class 7 [Thecaphora frezii]